MKKAVIVSGGYAETAFCMEYIKVQQPDFVIAVDSGMKFFYEAGMKPDIIVGDFDSVD